MAPDRCIPPPVQLPAYLHEPLIERDFVVDNRTYRRGALSFAAVGQWYVLRDLAPALSEWTLRSSLSQVGLWKWVQNGSPLHRVFEFPSWAVRAQADDDRFDDVGPAPFAKLLDWALASSFRRVPAGWQAPEREVVESWMPHGALTVQADGLVRQGELFRLPDRWALRFPVLPQLPNDLPEPRRRALEELVFDAQCRWAMVRFGIAADTDDRALVAEVDLTGAPPCELLFSAGLDVLRHVVAWLVETADVLADPSVAITCLAPGWNNTNPNERKEP